MRLYNQRIEELESNYGKAMKLNEIKLEDKMKEILRAVEVRINQ